jgi:hypothetical protein
MPYGFGNLSPADFEDLARDLIGRELGVRFGRIADIDVRPHAIAQVKSLSGSRNKCVSDSLATPGTLE